MVPIDHKAHLSEALVSARKGIQGVFRARNEVLRPTTEGIDLRRHDNVEGARAPQRYGAWEARRPHMDRLALELEARA